MAQYRVRVKSFIDNRLCEEGEVINYDGIPADNLEPMDSAGEKAAAGRPKAAVKDIARQRAAAATGDPENATSPLFQAAQESASPLA